MEYRWMPYHNNWRQDMNKSGKVLTQETEAADIDKLYDNSVELIQFARNMAVKQVNTVQLLTYYSLGCWIVEQQQQGCSRAKYGQQVIKKLSERLLGKFGKGFSEDTLKNCRKFYLTYKDRISESSLTFLQFKKVKQCLAFLKIRCPFRYSGHII